MARKSTREGADQTPPKMPEGPPTLSHLDHSWSLQAIMEMQKTLGELSASIKSLETAVNKQAAAIGNIKLILAGAAGAVTVILAVGGFIIDKLGDKIATLIAG